MERTGSLSRMSLPRTIAFHAPVSVAGRWSGGGVIPLPCSAAARRARDRAAKRTHSWKKATHSGLTDGGSCWFIRKLDLEQVVKLQASRLQQFLTDAP